MGRRCVTPYPTRPTRPLEHSHCRAKPPRTVRVHCEHILMWSESTGRTRRSGRSVYTGNPLRTVRERYARRVKLSVCTRPYIPSKTFSVITTLTGAVSFTFRRPIRWNMIMTMTAYEPCNHLWHLHRYRMKSGRYRDIETKDVDEK